MEDNYIPPHEKTRRLIGRLSAGRQLSTTFASGSTIKELEWSDIARALTRLRRPGKHKRHSQDRLAQCLLMYRWAGDVSVRIELVGLIAKVLSRRSESDGWRKRDDHENMPAWLTKMASLALMEMNHKKHCQECGATGAVWVPGRWVLVVDESVSVHPEDNLQRIWEPGHVQPCEACRGQGAYPWSKRERAAWMGAHHSTWSNLWDERYLWLLSFLDKVESRALGKIREVLR